MKFITLKFVILKFITLMLTLLLGIGMAYFVITQKEQAPINVDVHTSSESDAAFAARLEAALINNPDMILEALRKLDGRKKQDDLKADVVLIAANRDALQNDGMSWVAGNPEGDITVVEFIDYKCGYCRKAHSEVAELIKSDGNIRLIIKEYPILGEQSLYSSRLAIATLDTLGPEAYGKIHNLLMTHGGPVNTQTAAAILAQAGLDAAAVLPALHAKQVEDQIALTSALARRLNITGTPGFVVNDQIVRGYMPLASMRTMIAHHRTSKEQDLRE